MMIIQGVDKGRLVNALYNEFKSDDIDVYRIEISNGNYVDVSVTIKYSKDKKINK